MGYRARIPRRGIRYGPFVSVGDVLEFPFEGMRDTAKLQFLPQFEDDDDKNPKAVLHKRFVLADIGVTEINAQALRGLPEVASKLARAAAERPDELLRIMNAFGPAGTREDRETVPDRASELGLGTGTTGEPAALWGLLLLAGAVLLTACTCQETDTECDDGGTDTDDDK